MRKFVVFLLAVAATLVFCAGAAFAGSLVYYYPTDSGDINVYKDDTSSWQYIIVDDGLAIEKYLGNSTNVTLPSYLDGQPVVEISSYFRTDSLSAVEELTIPGGIKDIGSMAFRNCSNLSSVHFSEGLQTIGEWVFDGTALTAVTLPDSLVSIGSSAFINLSTLKNVTFGTGLQSIGSQAFYGTGITSLSLPDGLTTVGRIALYTDSLAEIDIPDTLVNYPSNLRENPFVSHSTTMVVGNNTNLLADILDAGLNNYRIRGESDTPEVTTGTTVTERVRAIVAEVVTDGMSDYDKALRLHDYLTQHAQYDNPTYLLNNNSNPDAYDAAGVLLRGYGVCDSYAKAYDLLMSEAGIPCVRITSSSHAWNMIQIDGQWVHVDCTWDDPTLYGQGAVLEPNARSGREGHAYFGLTDYAIWEVDEHQWSSKPYTATDYTLNYTYIHGGLNRRISLLVDAIEAKLNVGETSFTITVEGFEDDGYDGMINRLCVEAAADLVYLTDTGDYAVSLSYNHSNYELTCNAAPHKEELYYPAFTLSPADTFALPDALSIDASGVAQADGKVISFTGVGEATVVAEYDFGTITRTIHVRDMNTLTITAETVEDQAFAGTAAERVVISANVQSLGSEVFQGCDHLLVLRFEGQTVADPTIFMFGSNEEITVLAPAGSPAEDEMRDSDYRFFPLN